MSRVRFQVSGLTDAEVHGDLQADYLIGMDATLTIMIGERVCFAEPYFPVVELAWVLRHHMPQGLSGAFSFESMSSEGSVLYVAMDGDAWAIGSSLTDGLVATGLRLDEIAEGLDAFVADVEYGMRELGVDPEAVFHDEPEL